MRILRRPLLLVALMCVVGGSLYGVAVALTRKKEPCDPESRLLAVLAHEGKISAAGWPIVLCVREVSGRSLCGVVLKELDAQGEVECVIMASKADLEVDPEQRKLRIHLRQGVGKSRDGGRITFEGRLWDLPLPSGFE